MNPKDREHRFRRIREIGCLACLKLKLGYRFPEVHHLNLGGKAGQKRRGDVCTIGLCGWHHQAHVPQDMTFRATVLLLGPSLKLHSRAFRQKFGTDDELLRVQDRLIKEGGKMLVGANAA